MNLAIELYNEIFNYCEKSGLIQALEKSLAVPESEHFSSIDIHKYGLGLLDVVHCLYDKKRTFFFLDEIEKLVKYDQVVVEAGIGTGILSFYAAMLGARVYACELNPEVYALADDIRIHLQNTGVLKNEFPKFYQADATTFVPPEKADVIVSENLYTGMFFEQQVAIMNHLNKYLKPGGVVIPEGMKSYIAPCQINVPYTGDNQLIVPSTVDQHKTFSTQLATPVLYDTLDFNKKILRTVQTRQGFSINKYGIVNGIRIHSTVQMPSGTVIHENDTTFLNSAILIATKNKLHVSVGDTVDISCAYDYGSKPDDLDLDIKKINQSVQTS